MSSIDKKFYGVATGTYSTTRMMGQMLGMGFMVMMFNFYLGRGQITPVVYPLFLRASKMLFVFFGILCSAGMLALLLPKENRGCTETVENRPVECTSR
jgi:hypothetical protein